MFFFMAFIYYSENWDLEIRNIYSFLILTNNSNVHYVKKVLLVNLEMRWLRPGSAARFYYYRSFLVLSFKYHFNWPLNNISTSWDQEYIWVSFALSFDSSLNLARTIACSFLTHSFLIHCAFKQVSSILSLPCIAYLIRVFQLILHVISLFILYVGTTIPSYSYFFVFILILLFFIIFSLLSSSLYSLFTL